MRFVTFLCIRCARETKWLEPRTPDRNPKHRSDEIFSFFLWIFINQALGCFQDDLRIDFGSFKHFADIVIWKLDFLNFLGFIQLGICQLSIQDV